MKFALVAALLLLPSLALAQTAPPALTLSLSPIYAVPYGTAVLNVQSTLIDLANATLTVTVGGTQVYKGGVKPVGITIGAAGATTAIKAVVVSGGQSYSQSLNIMPGDVSLVQEPVASAPPLYAGKPLLPLSGQVRLVAIAGFRTKSGAAISPAMLSYSWSQDGTVLVDSSGIGKSAVLVDAPLQYRASNVSVVVSTQDGAEVGGASVSLTAQNPTVRIYANDPLLGIRFDHALAGSFAIKDAEASFYAAPYSFSMTNGTPLINWFLNGSAAGSDSVLTLRPTGSGAGNGTLSVSASEAAVYENAAQSLSLSFGSSGTNFFGL